MRAWVVAIVGALLIADVVALATATAADDTTPEKLDAETQAYIDKLKAFDALAYARSAIASRDFRLVIFNGVWSALGTPGVRCVANGGAWRRLFFSDVIYPGDSEIREELERLARQFNRAIVGSPEYPDKDVCYVGGEKDTAAEAARITGAPARRPKIVDLPTAVRAQDRPQALRYIKEGAKIDAEDSHSFTPLLWAVQRANIPIATDVMKAGADANRLLEISSPLTLAAQNGDLPMLRILLENTPPARRGPDWRTNAHAYPAITLNRIDLLQLLIAHQAVPEETDARGWDFLLGRAVQRRLPAMVDAVLAIAGKTMRDAHLLDDVIENELDAKDEAKARILVSLARAAGDTVTYSQNSSNAVAAAIDAQQGVSLERLLQDGKDVNLLSGAEAKLLVEAARSGDEPALNKLIALAETRKEGLYAAIIADDTASIARSMQPGATLEQRNAYTPLMLAAERGQPRTLEKLIELGAVAGAAVNHIAAIHSATRTVSEDDTAIVLAMQHSNLQAAGVLMRHGADIDGREGPWPFLTIFSRELERATAQDRKKFADLFLNHKPSRLRQGRADLILASAANWSDEPIARFMLDRGARPCAEIDFHNAAIELAAGNLTFDAFKLFVRRCTGWSFQSKFARGALREALHDRYGDTAERMKVIRYLLENKTPIPPPEIGWSEICSAALVREREVFELLADHMTDINEIVGERTALDCAEYLNDPAIVAKLRKRGAKTANELGVPKRPTPFPF